MRLITVKKLFVSTSIKTSDESMGGVYQELEGAKHPQGRSKVLILMM